MGRELYYLSAHKMLEMLDKREISSRELVFAHLERIKKVEPDVCAFLSIDEEGALKQAEKADEMRARGVKNCRLLGLPVAVKDNICVRGQPCTCASRILEGFYPPYDATVIRKLHDAGAIILGKTNMDEFAMGSSTEHSRFFPTHNPWKLDRVPGGSSGGSAAAVSAGEVPLSIGSDTGGSIRQPAAFCGIVGMKPTYGLVSRYGLVAFASSLDQIGPLGREVADIALLLSVIAGKDKMDSTSIPVKSGDYTENLEEDISGLRIGIPLEFMKDLAPGVKNIVESAAEVYKKKGVRIVEVSLPHVGYSLPAYYIIAPAECSSNLARYDGSRYGHRTNTASDVLTMFKKTRMEGFGPEVKRRIMIGTYVLSSGYFDAYYLKAQKVRTLIRRDFESAFKDCDVMLGPSTPATAFPIGEKVGAPVSMYLSDIYTIAANLAGLPALVINGGFIDGLPVGIQLIGKHLGESTLLRLGHQFQLETDFHIKNPRLN
ncbi:MAG: Asp-tRNA(Asn)/Glu-tRNA(Gln) amidotransferase subunit GatA [Candidatus Eremiobacteraeota bacterium]|nr:Asp-tRNA(Asn)/Glu-tRNA(Gln) amidotransferase subunit GatA [Candidatus Eremiobacteraeota bacterium]